MCQVPSQCHHHHQPTGAAPPFDHCTCLQSSACDEMCSAGALTCSSVLPFSCLTVSSHSAPYLLNGWASHNSGVVSVPEGTAFLSGQQQGCAVCHVLLCFYLWAFTRCESFSKINSRKCKCCQLDLSLDLPPSVHSCARMVGLHHHGAPAGRFYFV